MVLENLAAVKDQHELNCLRTAVEITDKVYEEDPFNACAREHRKTGCKFYGF